MLCCVIPLLLMVAMRKVFVAAFPLLGRAEPDRAMPPAAHRVVDPVIAESTVMTR